MAARDSSPDTVGGVLAMLTTRKWIGLSILALAVIVAFGALSAWQWQRAQRDEAVSAAIPASDVLTAGVPLATSAYGTVVSANGTYDAAHQVVVVHGNGTFWVVTPLQPSSGAAIPVARATVTSLDDPAVADVTSGTVTVTGVAQPYEGDPGTPSTLPAGQTERLTVSGLALPYPASGGWIALQSQTPTASVAAAPVLPPVTQQAGGNLRLQNASYAVQWLLFAGFVVFFWTRMLRDDLGEAGPAPTRQETAPVREVY
jgi:cytochrome oxidase assembly protein ShyY1